MDTDKIPEYIKLLFVLNSICLFSLIVLAFYVTSQNVPAKENQSLSATNQPENKSINRESENLAKITAIPESKESTTQKSSAETTEKIFSIEINDSGIYPKGFQVAGGNPVTLSVANKGQKIHSFIIEGLGSGTGPIEPGQIKEIKIKPLPDESKIYVFYSDIETDPRDNFNGVMMVLKNQN